MQNTNRIQLLDTLTANQIAAGEVVERPLSVVKELVENAIDAAATRVEVKIFDDICEKIQVADNGVGMSPEDMRLCVQRHATSKIRLLEDLQNLFTLGFRGEALPSIASVSHVTITSKQAHAPLGYRMRVEEGKPRLPEETGARDGTVVLVERLFYNAPARKKFLKSPRWELGLISDCLQKLALSHPHIAFSLVMGKKTMFASDGGGDLSRAVLAVYGTEVLDKLVGLDYTAEDTVINGFTSLPELNRSDRGHYTFFVNNRWVRSRELSAMVDEAYRTMLPSRRYPLLVLNMRLPQPELDVNVHPAKMEIKFQQPAKVKDAVRAAIHEALLHKEALAPRLQTPRSFKPAELEIDRDSGFIKLKENTGLRLRESKGAALDGKTLAERLYAGPTERNKPARPAAPHVQEQRLDFAPVNSPPIPQPASPPIPQPVSDGFAAYSQAITGEPSEAPPPSSAISAPPLLLRYAELQVLGQTGGSYIVAAGEDGLYLIDQHAAHERVLYEQMKAKAAECGGESRMLAIPQTINLTIQEHIILTEGILHVNELGFIVEHFGENTYIIRGAPLWYEGSEPEQLMRDLLSRLAEEKGDFSSMRQEEIFMAACKQAVKANRYLSPGDVGALLTALDNCENPSTCPHGRPVAIKLTFAEIRKRFMRSGVQN
ncbi:MAG: DNA mismatch repair endonuclease MutL [Clostridiales bacterium]|nr:DNA mismatch repair endonuclease MutL [Clostridiales bacterium]